MRTFMRAIGAYSKYRIYITCARDRVESAKSLVLEAVGSDMALDHVECHERDPDWFELEVQLAGEHLMDSWLAVFLTRLERERGIRGIEMRAAG